MRPRGVVSSPVALKPPAARGSRSLPDFNLADACAPTGGAGAEWAGLGGLESAKARVEKIVRGRVTVVFGRGVSGVRSQRESTYKE